MYTSLQSNGECLWLLAPYKYFKLLNDWFNDTLYYLYVKLKKDPQFSKVLKAYDEI